jgi:hypothetical protein
VLLPVSILMVMLQDGPIWAGVVGWLVGVVAIAAVVLILRALKV